MKILLFTSLIIYSLNLSAYERMTVKDAQACTVSAKNGKETCGDIPVKNLVLDFDFYKGQLWWKFAFEIQPTPLNPQKVPVNLPLAMGDGNFAGCYNHIGGSGGNDKNDYNFNSQSGLISLDYAASVS